MYITSSDTDQFRKWSVSIWWSYVQNISAYFLAYTAYYSDTCQVAYAYTFGLSSHYNVTKQYVFRCTAVTAAIEQLVSLSLVSLANSSNQQCPVFCFTLQRLLTAQRRGSSAMTSRWTPVVLSQSAATEDNPRRTSSASKALTTTSSLSQSRISKSDVDATTSRTTSSTKRWSSRTLTLSQRGVDQTAE